MFAIRTDGDALCFEVLVQPRASRLRIGPVQGERLKIAVTAPPVDGAANKAVVEAVAKALGVAKRDVTVTAGATGRRKTVRVVGVQRAALEALAS